MKLEKRLNVRPALVVAGVGALLLAGAITAQQASTPQQAQAPASEIRITAASANVAQPGDQVTIKLVRWSTNEERDEITAAMTVQARPAGARGAGGRGAAPRGGRGAPDPDDPAAVNPTDPFGTFGGSALAGGPIARGNAPAGQGAPFDQVVSLKTALGKIATIGYLWTSEVTGYPIKYAYRIPAADGGVRVIIAIDRKLGAFSAGWKPTANATDYPFTVIEMKLAKGVGEGKTSLNTKVTVDSAAKTIALESYDATPSTLKNVKQ